MRSTIIMVETWAESAHVERLQERLGDARVIALPPPSPDRAPARVDGWIDHHLAQLRLIDTMPPYRLVGWSFGGVIALELARRLRAAGRPVDYVAMLDSIRPWLRPLRWRDAVPYHLSEAALIPSADVRRAYLTSQAKMMVHRQLRNTPLLPSVFPSLRNRTTGPKREKPTDPLVRSIHKSYLNYAGAPVDFPVSLFVTASSIERCHGDASLRWAPYLRAGYQTISVAGGHHGMWEEAAVDTLAAALERDLERAAGERTATTHVATVTRRAAPPPA